MNSNQNVNDISSPSNHFAANAQHAFYSQQMLLQQQYMPMSTIYGAQQILQPHQMDIHTFQQQHQLLQAMQQQQHQQQQQQQHHQNQQQQHQHVLHNQTSVFGLSDSNSIVQQQAVFQQPYQQYQRALQHQRQLEQHRLLQQQKRQLNRMHEEREAFFQQEQEALQRHKAEEDARHEQARLEHEELQRRIKEQQKEKFLLEQQRLKEEQRKKEEAIRLAEEQRKNEEKERKELEKIMAVREEQKRRQKEAEEAFIVMREKASGFPVPIHLAGCHVLTKLANHLPFPSPFLPHSDYLKVNLYPHSSSLVLEQNDQGFIMLLSNALSEVDVSEVCLKHEDGENNDLGLDSSMVPALVKNIASLDAHAFDVNPRQDSAASTDEILQIPLEQERNQVGVEGLCISSQANFISDVENKKYADESKSSVCESTPTTSSTGCSLLDQDQTQLRRQIVSLGKQPKAQHGRRKRDMVESLIDSLTPFFGVTKERRQRQRTKTFEEEQHEKMQLEMIAQMELAEEKEKIMKDSMLDKTEHRPDHVGPSNEIIDKPKFFESNKISRKRVKDQSPDHLERPITPTEIIQQRETEWREREKKRKEKYKRRQNDSEDDCWNNEVMAEKESYARFTSIIDQIFDNVEDLDIMGGIEDDAEIPQELLIDKHQLEELRQEAQKLKSWKVINKVNPERIVKLLTILEKNIRDVITVDGGLPLILPFFEDGEEDESDEAYRELIVDRILRAADASCTAMMIMTSTKMPKQVFIEDTIDRSIQLCKQFLTNIVFPAFDGVCRVPSKAKRTEDKKRRKIINQAYLRTTQKIYTSVTELVGCFSELVRAQSLTDTAILQLCSLATPSFFVDNVGELQMQSIKLLSAIFARYDMFRKNIIQDLLNSLHRLPSIKNAKNSYRLTSEDWISNLTILIMQLVQCTVKIPRRRRNEDSHHSDGDEDASNKDSIVKCSFAEAQKMATIFLKGFLGKCTAKSEEDYRRLFDQFLHDLLAALYKPEWPAAEMMLHILGSLLVNFYRSKTLDMSLRIASLDYLGTITARLRKDIRQACSDDDRLDLVVRTLLYDELDENERVGDVSSVDISHLSGMDKMCMIERALIDYLIEKKGNSDVSVEQAIMFYIGQWYKEICDESDAAKQNLKQTINNPELSDKERKKFEKRADKAIERCHSMKEFLVKLADKKHMRKRAEHISRTGNILIDSDALWLIKYLTSNREFSQCFHLYLNHILYGVHSEQTVGLRTKAMRCLTLIIESDLEVLRMPEVQCAVQVRMMDSNAAVREATIELIGKYVVAKPDYINQYYPILIDRIKDSGVAVRKRVIRIMREICEKQPDFEGIPEMLSKIVRRIADEDGVKKLTIETFQALFFQPVRERDSIVLIKKVMTITDVILICIKENTVEFFEQLLNLLIKSADRSIIFASRQIVDTLVDNVITLDSKLASGETEISKSSGENSSLNLAVAHKEHQERLLACLTTLSLFSKVRASLMVKHAETLQPYLSINLTGSVEQRVMNQIINMLERVVPLMEHPSESFLKSLDASLCNLVMDGNMRIIASALACISAIYNKWKRWRPAVIQRFLSYLRFLNQTKGDFENKPGYILPKDKSPVVQRSLYSVGLMSRYFDLDDILVDDPEAKSNLSGNCSLRPIKDSFISTDAEVQVEKKEKPFTDDVFRVLTFFCRSRDAAIRMKALTAIGNFTATNAEYLSRHETRNMYVTLLGLDDKEYLDFKILTLRNIELFLSTEESKLAKNNDEWQKVKDDQDLKEMELANSGLASAIIQIYWNAILNSYFNSDDNVRTSAVQVTMLTLSQGLVTPGSSIPTLIAMSTDSIPGIRNKVENMLKDIDTKYSGMVPSKAVAGIRCAFRLHRLIKKDSSEILRGIRRCESLCTANTKMPIRMENGIPKMTNDGQAMLCGLYQSLRTNRQIRRSFLSSLLRLFSEDCREKLSLEEWVFVADNLAMFPYQVMDEPLYVIRQIESIVSISGQNIINNFMTQLVPKPPGGELDDDAEFNAELIYRRLPEDKSLLYDCMKNSQACFLLLYLKNFLMKLYGFSEAKVQEYSPSEAAKIYEKALNSRKNIAMFYPQTALQELRPETASQRDTVNSHINMANQIVYFRNMLLSLDQSEDDDNEINDTIGPMVNEIIRSGSEELRNDNIEEVEERIS